jgi:hypothetical protein
MGKGQSREGPLAGRAHPVYRRRTMPTDPTSKPKATPPSSEANMLGLVKIMEWSLALAFGTLAAATAGVKKLWEDHSMTFSIWVIIAPAAVVTLNWLFWRHVKRKIAREGVGMKKRGKSAK